MKHILFIALGGAGGALARHWMSTLVHASTRSHFPWGTLSVNLIGSFCIGIAYVMIIERGMVHPDWRSVTMVGFLGAFTTFSTFSLEALALIENGQAGLGLAYVGLSVAVCLFAVWLAMTLMRMV
ncbi:MAG: fluoride efflux transporter CrcB [Halieaceae bacterium]